MGKVSKKAFLKEEIQKYKYVFHKIDDGSVEQFMAQRQPLSLFFLKKYRILQKAILI